MITHARLSQQASFLAKNSADWAAELLMFPEKCDKPVSDRTMERFLKYMQERLDIIKEMHEEDQT